MAGFPKFESVRVVVLLAATVVACSSSPSGNGSAGGTAGTAGGTNGGGGSAGGTAGTAGGTNGGGGSAGAGGGGGTGGAGGAPACGISTGGTDSGASCNVIAANGPCVTGIFSTAAAPMPAGGAFAAGTYDLVSQTFYAPADAGVIFLPGQPRRQTYLLSDVTSSSFTLDQVASTGTVVARSHETAAVSGMTATFTQTCPPADAGIDWGGSPEFTATSTSITFFWPRTSGVEEVTVYNKGPDPG